MPKDQELVHLACRFALVADNGDLRPCEARCLVFRQNLTKGFNIWCHHTCLLFFSQGIHPLSHPLRSDLAFVHLFTPASQQPHRGNTTHAEPSPVEFIRERKVGFCTPENGFWCSTRIHPATELFCMCVVLWHSKRNERTMLPSPVSIPVIIFSAPAVSFRPV